MNYYDQWLAYKILNLKFSPEEAILGYKPSVLFNRKEIFNLEIEERNKENEEKNIRS